MEESFFQLGASSLHIVRLSNRLRETLGREVPLMEMFRFSNVATLAAHLSAQDGGAPAAPDARLDQAERRAAARRGQLARRGGGE
jgi:hypothetical protein